MKLLNRFPVAVVLTALIIVLCCVWGYSRVSVPTSEMEEIAPTETGRAGESNLNYYLRQTQDDAGIFTLETADTIARRNLTLDNSYRSILAIHTVTYLNGKPIETYAQELAEEIELAGRDMLLLLDTDTQGWYLVYGPGLQPYAETSTDLRDLFRGQLTSDFFENGSNQKVLLLFNALDNWFADNVPPADAEASITTGHVQTATLYTVFTGILFTLLTNIWWILLLLVVLTLLDRARFSHYNTAHPQGHDPADPFRPLLFWHHAGSGWYRNMQELMESDGEF